MNIRKRQVDEWSHLWNNTTSNTYNYFKHGLEQGNIECWTVDIEQEFVAELYILWCSEDPDEANGVNRAYLCAFRVREDFQHKGIGTMLMHRVLQRVQEEHFTEVTIGVDPSNQDQLENYYATFGFHHLVKYTEIDLHDRDQSNQPVQYKQQYKIMLKKYGNS